MKQKAHSVPELPLEWHIPAAEEAGYQPNNRGIETRVKSKVQHHCENWIAVCLDTLSLARCCVKSKSFQTTFQKETVLLPARNTAWVVLIVSQITRKSDICKYGKLCFSEAGNVFVVAKPDRCRYLHGLLSSNYGYHFHDCVQLHIVVFFCIWPLLNQDALLWLKSPG